MTPADESYEKHKKRAAARQREKSAAGRDIGALPPIEDPARRTAAEASLFVFLDTYFKEVFYLPWSPDHLEVIAELEGKILRGGIKTYAMERGSGKSAIAERAAIWAACKGIHEFVVVVGASAPASAENMQSIKAELAENELLLADFPEVCFPFHEIEDRSQRCKGQTFDGEPTRIGWWRDTIVFPTIPGSKASGAIIRTASITGRMRGMKFKRPDGRISRPSLAIVDDFQTEKSADSPTMCDKRLKTINGAIMKMAGPDKKITVFIPCTVIHKGDAADQLLNRDKFPHFHGHRSKKLKSFPTRMDLWQEFWTIHNESVRAGGDGLPATEFYRERQAEMDAGAVVTWPQRFEPQHLSAVQTCMVLFFEDRYSFMAECQNDPIDELAIEGRLTPAEIVGRFTARPQFVVPVWADKLTCFIDVQKTLLFGCVVAWKSNGFTGAVIHYGSWPEQPGRTYFTLADAQHTFPSKFPGLGLEGQIQKAIATYAGLLLGREWKREDGTGMKIDRALVDSSYEMDTVFEACRTSPHAGVLMPSRGVSIRATQKPMHEYATKPGDQKGYHWIIGPQQANKRVIRACRIDVNYWKSWVESRIRQAVGEVGALAFYGHDRRESPHDMIADHICAETGILAEAQGRKVVEWIAPVGCENHWFDALVGASAAASTLGCTLVGQDGTERKRPKKSIADMNREAQKRQAEKKRVAK